jgi:hypothetical protein
MLFCFGTHLERWGWHACVPQRDCLVAAGMVTSAAITLGAGHSDFVFEPRGVSGALHSEREVSVRRSAFIGLIIKSQLVHAGAAHLIFFA